MDKTQDALDLYFLTRNVVWRYRLDQYEDATIREMLKTVRAAVADVQLQLFNGDAVPRGDALLDELQALSAGLRKRLGEDVADMATEALNYSAQEHASILSIDGRVPINNVALSADQFRAFMSSPATGGVSLPAWVDAAWGSTVTEQVKRNLNIAVLQGESYQKAVRGLLDSTIADFTEREAITIARTYVQTANVAAQMSLYEANDDLVTGWKWSAVLEQGYSKTGRGTCIRCAALDGRIFPMGKGPSIPAHSRCRCCALPVLKSWRELGLDRDELDAAIRPYTIRPDVNIDAGGMRTIIESGRHQGDYASWFEKQSAEFKVNVVGPGRYKLLQGGKISFNDLADDMGRTRPISELERIIQGKMSKNADVIFTEHVQSIGLKAPLKVEYFGPNNEYTNVQVQYVPRSGKMKFEVLPDGSPVLYADPIWERNMDELRRSMLSRSVQDYLSPLEEDVFLRAAPDKKDYDYLKAGTHRGSKNWATGEMEAGISVAKKIEVPTKHAYYVRGNVVGEGSDGEPVLDVRSARPIGKLKKYDDVYEEFREAQYRKGLMMGFSRAEIKALLTSKSLAK